MMLCGWREERKESGSSNEGEVEVEGEGMAVTGGGIVEVECWTVLALGKRGDIVRGFNLKVGRYVGFKDRTASSLIRN